MDPETKEKVVPEKKVAKEVFVAASKQDVIDVLEALKRVNES